MNPKNKLAEMPVRPLLYTMAVPLMLSLLIQSLYNIVDMMPTTNRTTPKKMQRAVF